MAHRLGADCPLSVAHDYTDALLRDPESRLFAAIERWPMPLPDWVRRRSALVLHAMAGVEPTWPWDIEPEATPEELALARRVLDERSAIRD